MTQDELWMNKWQEAIVFLETNNLHPLKFVLEERGYEELVKIQSQE